MNLNITDIIYNKSLQARQALYSYTENFTEALGTGNKTKMKIQKFNLLSVLLLYIESKSKPSTLVEGKNTSPVIISNFTFY